MRRAFGHHLVAVAAVLLIAAPASFAASPAPPHDHGAGDEHAEVHLTPEAAAGSGLQVEAVRRDTIASGLSLTGSVGANEDRTVHLNPKVEGLVRKVLRTLGDRVKEGEPLVLLDSVQLGQAKVEFLKLLADHQLAITDLERKAKVKVNSAHLVALLSRRPAPLEAQRKTEALALGEHRARLLTRYSALRLAEAAHQREERLYRQRVSSEREYLEAQRDHETAQAEFTGAVDEATFASTTEYLIAERTHRTRETAFNAAQRQLEVLGSTGEELWQLREGKAQDLSLFTIRAPLSGTITEKHATLGERVTSENSLFTLTDLTSLWVLAEAHEKDLAQVYVGMPASVQVGAYPNRTFPGKVSVVSPVIDPKTRTAHLRVEVDNAEGLLALGMFAKVHSASAGQKDSLVVPVAALQVVRGNRAVFVRESDTVFELREIQIGVRDADRGLVQILSGLKEGEKVATEGAFYLKSELLKHEGGHDHAH